MPAAKTASQAQLKTVHGKLDAKIDGVGKRLDGVEKRLDAKIDGVIVEVVKLQASVRDIQHTLETRVASKDDFGRLMAAIDAFARTNEIHARETLMLPKVIDEQGKQIRDHETRLGEHDRRLKAVEARF